MSWDPQQYLAFTDHRLRPAIDLLNRIDLAAPRTIIDLGCGTGNVTKLLKQRWPDAQVIGIDNSAAMLMTARQKAPEVEFHEADLATWQTATPVDLIYSNAALQWLDRHDSLFPNLMQQISPGGVFAIQMPRNHNAPSHMGINMSIAAGPWVDKLNAVRSIRPVGDPSFYYDLLQPHATNLDIWESEFLQILEGNDPVVEWTKGTALRPYLDALNKDEQEGFLKDYRQRMRAAYPPRADGRTLFPFKRLFMLGHRPV